MRFLSIILLAGLCACESTPIRDINAKYKQALEQRWAEYRIKPGDTLALRFYNQDIDLNQGPLLVLPDGRTDPFFMDDAVVAGKTVKELEKDLAARYAGQVRNPEVSVSLTPAAETVIVEGEVLRPLPLPYTVRMTLMQAIGNAGSYKITACLHTVILRRPYLNPAAPDVYRIDLTKYYDTPEELFLLPSDHIIVEKNWVIYVRDWINEYIWGYLPPFLRTFPFAIPI